MFSEQKKNTIKEKGGETKNKGNVNRAKRIIRHGRIAEHSYVLTVVFFAQLLNAKQSNCVLRRIILIQRKKKPFRIT